MKKNHINSNLYRMLFLVIGILLHNHVSGQNAYFSDRTETVLTYYGFTDDKRKELLIELSDSGYSRAMYYLAEKYEHPTKSKIELIKESAEKGFFVAECELGNRYIKGWGCARNQDSAYYWLRKAIEHTEPFVESDKKQYYKTIKTWEGQHNLSVEIERMTTYALAHSIMSQYYMEKGQMEQGLEYAQKGYNLMDKIYLEPKGWTVNADIYKEMLSSNWYSTSSYLAAAYYVIGDLKKGDKFDHVRHDFVKIESDVPWNLLYAGETLEWKYYKAHPLALKYYLKAVDKRSYTAMLHFGNRPSIKNRIKEMAITGDSIAALFYLYHLSEDKGTVNFNLFLKELPYKLRFSYSGYKTIWMLSPTEYKNIITDLPKYLLKEDVVYTLIINDLLVTNEESLLKMIEHYLKSSYNATYEVVQLYEKLLLYHPHFKPSEKLTLDVGMCYYHVSVQHLIVNGQFAVVSKIEESKKALLMLKKVCDTYPEALKYIAEILYEGETGTPDYQEAFKYLKLGEKYYNSTKEDLGRSRVFYWLGMCYLKGRGVQKDEKKGFECMEKSVNCHGIYTKAFLEIANCYRFGRGTQRDLEKAKFYESEAEKYNKEDARLLEDIRRPLE